MRTFARVLLISVALSAGFLAAACDTIENLAIFDTKKKLPGERKPVFPEGVPGVSQGIPPELMQGYQEPAQQSPTANASALAGTQAAAKQNPEASSPQQAEAAKPKPKPKPKQVARPQPKPQAAPTDQAQAPWPQQSPAQTTSSSNQTAWPAPQPQAAWPTAPSSDRFSR